MQIIFLHFFHGSACIFSRGQAAQVWRSLISDVESALFMSFSVTDQLFVYFLVISNFYSWCLFFYKPLYFSALPCISDIKNMPNNINGFDSINANDSHKHSCPLACFQCNHCPTKRNILKVSLQVYPWFWFGQVAC